MTSRFRDTKVDESQKCTERLQTDHKHLTSKSNQKTTNLYPRGSNFGPFHFTTTGFRVTRLSKIENAPSGMKHLTVKSTLYTLKSPYSRCPNFCPFRSWTASCKIQRCQKLEISEMHRLTSDWPWRLKSTLFTVNTYPRSPIVVRFTLWTAIFKMQGCRNSEKLQMHHLTSDWLWTLSGQKYPVYGKYLCPRPKLWSLYLYGQPVRRNKVCRKCEKCTEWPQTDLEQLTIKLPSIH